MLKKLVNLIEYLPTIGEGVHIVGDEPNGATRLNSPAIRGRQIVVALPLAELEGNCDHMTGPHTFIVFVVEKTPAASGTPEQVRRQYIECARQLEKILGKITGDITGGNGRQCPLLAGFDLKGVQVTPEAGVFGSWSGFSATITLR